MSRMLPNARRFSGLVAIPEGHKLVTRVLAQ